MPELILASTSPYRRELLSRLGVPFTVEAPRCDEDAFKQLGKPPSELARLLAREKALSVAQTQPRAYVLGSDQLADLEGEILGKPHTPERAHDQLSRMREREHRLITAIALVCPDGRVLEHVDVTTLAMRALTDEEIDRYVAADNPVDCAGSYKIEGRGIGLFEHIDTDDFTAITGLPLITLTSMLRVEGFAVP